MEDLEPPNINMVYNTQCPEFHDDPIQVVQEEPFIEDIIEDPPHVTSMEPIEYWGPSHDYFNDEYHICTPGQSQDETITESYNETYDGSCNVHDGTPTFSPYNDDSMEGLLPCDLFF